MTLTEFFEVDEEAPVAQAFKAVRRAFDRHMDTLGLHEYSPWTLCLGKGGAKPGGGYYEGQEQSLYRHCMEVAVFGAWLFYHAWRAKRPPLARIDDPAPVLRTLFAIAFAHDADKRQGDGKSRSPTPDDVRQVYEELGMADWSGLTLPEMATAVSLVEKRGLGRAAFGEVLVTPLVDKLAELIHQGDNLLSRVARQGGSAREFVAAFNADLPMLHRLYGVPNQILHLVRFRHHPIVLYRLQTFLSPWFAADEFYPLVFVRRGEWLELGIGEGMGLPAWLDRFEAWLADSEPSLKVNPTNGTVTLFNVGGADDLMSAVRDRARQAELLLRVTAKDWETVAPLVNFWVMRCGAPLATVPMKGNLCPVLKAGGEVSSSHPLWRAAALAAAQSPGDRSITDKLLAEAAIADGLRQNGLVPEQLDGLSLRTAVALQASFLTGEDDFSDLLNRAHGPWPEQGGVDPGARAIVRRLKAQIGCADLEEEALPYAKSAPGGTCLLCGAPAERPIETGTMKLAGIKASSFCNRIGHEKYLWSEKGENYLCPACVRIQGLLLETQPTLRANPMPVATPVRHLLDRGTGDGQKNVLRGYDAVSKDNRHKILPWNADAGFDEPLSFEERPTGLADTIDHMYRLACYAALSGEPVHAFIASQRECRAAFLYEGTPELLKELLHDLTTDEGGISRACLARLIRRLDLFRALLAENDGMAGMQAMPRFGWWAAAFVLGRAADKGKNGWNARTVNHVEFAREDYPMNEYDNWLDTLVQRSVEIHPFIKRDASGAEWTLMLRTALETYQKHYAFGPRATQDAITQTLRANLSRRLQDDLIKKDLDERLQAFAEAAYELLVKADGEFELESGFLRFLLAAYEGGYRRQLTEYWRHKKSGNEAQDDASPEPTA
jgi:hypothetical protein